MRTFLRSKKGIARVLGTLMMIIVVLVSGFFLLNFVMSNVDSMKTIFSSQMKGLLIESFSANTTHIIVQVKNTANKLVEITQAYVDNTIATLQEGKTILQPLSTGIATIIGSFTSGNTYTIKLTNIFNAAVSLTVTI